MDSTRRGTRTSSTRLVLDIKLRLVSTPAIFVWVHGPFPAGCHDDRTIYRLGLKRRLRLGELVWADGGYRGDQTILPRFLPGLNQMFLQEMARGRARHETINGRLIDWAVLRDGEQASSHLCFYCNHDSIGNVAWFHSF